MIVIWHMIELAIVLVGLDEGLEEGLAVGFGFDSIGDKASFFSSVLQTLFTWQLFPWKKWAQHASALGWIILGSDFKLSGYPRELLHQFPDILVKSRCHSLLTQSSCWEIQMQIDREKI